METNNNNDNMIDAGVAVAASQTKKVARKAAASAIGKRKATMRRAKKDENQVVIQFNKFNEKFTHVQHEGAGRPGVRWERVIPRSTFQKATDVEIATGLAKTPWSRYVSKNNLNVRINGIRRKLAATTGQDYTCKHKFGRARKVLVK